MTDTEILNALSYLVDDFRDLHGVGQDVLIGSASFTLPARGRDDLRELLQRALEPHLPRLVARRLLDT